MMDAMMKLPDDMFRLELVPYLSVDDVVKLDNACMNHKYRPQLRINLWKLHYING